MGFRFSPYGPVLENPETRRVLYGECEKEDEKEKDEKKDEKDGGKDGENETDKVEPITVSFGSSFATPSRRQILKPTSIFNSSPNATRRFSRYVTYFFAIL